MASTTDTAGATQDNPPGPNSPRRGGNRGRGGARRIQGSDEGHEYNPRGRGRGGNRGGQRGRGDRGGGSNRGGRPPERSLGKVPATTADSLEGVLSASTPSIAVAKARQETAEEAEDGEVCFICASPVQHIAVAPCNHRTCHICSLRLRALYKTKTCAHCRTESEHVIFTDDATKDYQDFAIDTFYKSDDNLGIRFENAEIYEDTVLLLRYNCPDEECDVACLGWPDLHRHVKTAHGKVMCDLCTRNKKVFTHEHELFTFAELKKHQKFGDDNPGAIDQSGFKGHPDCGFCRLRFYGDDELYTHCRDKHERCHICDRRSEGRKQQYYVNYDSLEEHFKKDHFLCPDQECLDKKFVVFDSEMDLKAHQLESHPNGLSKDARRDARRVDMSGFDIRGSQEHERGGGRREGGRGRGRGRDPNSEPLPQSSAQPMSRAEMAYQRQMAVQSAQSVSGRTFGGQLTAATETYTARPSPRAGEQPTVTASRPPAQTTNITSNLNQLSLEPTPVGSAPRTPQEQARLLRHNAVTERATNMLRNDQMKLGEFRNRISAFRNSKMSGTELIEAFFALFDTSSAELGKLIKELADIFEIQSKRDNLLKAWNDWKAINEDYPSLPGGPALSLGGASTGHGGSRVLKLKSSTAQSSRSAVSRKASWATASSSNPFPPLAAASSSRIGAKPGQTPWASGPATSSRPSPMSSRATSSVALNKKSNDEEAFPALPMAPKPTSTIFSPGYSGAGLRRDNSGRNTPANAWGASAAAGASNDTAGVEPEEAFGGGGKKKGKQSKKQTIFHFG
ncbi:hypothetical protein BCR34DRAFT_483192 [Clohesyomyces aquaticus]|uniref:RING-type E3 ubiquitin transferase n=1 Tax=Clohesyomyces aquaticus TaxID=1231657 RepID=A0A1Y1ZPG7_9PLEO|nr:hypothetical protein BCR34DRAFT_483192 [Clohesyomyces aquaticus]